MMAKPMKTLELHYPTIQFLITKNRLVCKNAVAGAYYGNCRLLVMGSGKLPWQQRHLTPDNNLVTKKRGGYISCLSKPCFFCWQFVVVLDKRSNYNTFVDSYFHMKFVFPLIRARVWANMDFNSANSSSFTSFPKGSKEPVILHFLKPSLWSRVNPGLPARSSLSVS